MSISFASGQTSGVPLLITAINQLTALLLHTAPVGSNTPHRIRLFAMNEDTVSHVVYALISNKAGTNARLLTYNLGIGSGFEALASDEDHELVLNGEATIKVWCDIANKVSVTAEVENQAEVAGTSVQSLSSGLVAAVQASDRYAFNAQGGVGQASRVNAEVVIAADGMVTDFVAFPDAAVGGGCTVNVFFVKNGIETSLTLLFVNGSGTGLQLMPNAVPVEAGDRVCFKVTCDNAGAPAANFQMAAKYKAS